MEDQGDTTRNKASDEFVKALNIIINKQVDMERFISLVEDQTQIVHAHLYNMGKTGSNSLTKAEFDLLERVYYQLKQE